MEAEAPGRGWLSPGEAERLHAITATRRRAQFVAGRWLLRQLIASVHGGDARCDWPLSAATDAAPRVLCDAPEMHLALSHSANHVVCGVAGAPIGIDIEAPERERNRTALAAAVCTPGELQRLQCAAEAQHAELFHALWTLKEAWLKQRGEGVSPQRLAGLHTRAALPAECGNAWLWQSPGMAFALCAESGAAPQWLGSDAPAPHAARWCVGPAPKA
jgi:4'-phosphopantetheinyl transferase